MFLRVFTDLICFQKIPTIFNLWTWKNKKHSSFSLDTAIAIYYLRHPHPTPQAMFIVLKCYDENFNDNKTVMHYLVVPLFIYKIFYVYMIIKRKKKSF